MVGGRRVEVVFLGGGWWGEPRGFVRKVGPEVKYTGSASGGHLSAGDGLLVLLGCGRAPWECPSVAQLRKDPSPLKSGYLCCAMWLCAVSGFRRGPEKGSQNCLGPA